MIPEIEINLAVINVSLEQWCNSTGKSFAKTLLKSLSGATQDCSVQPNTLVPSTSNFESENLDVDSDCSHFPSSSINIPETEMEIQHSNVLVAESESIYEESEKIDKNSEIDIPETQHDNLNVEHQNLDFAMPSIQIQDNNSSNLPPACVVTTKRKQSENDTTKEQELAMPPPQTKRAKISSNFEGFGGDDTAKKIPLQDFSVSQNKLTNTRKRRAPASSLEGDFFNFKISGRSDKRAKTFEEAKEPGHAIQPQSTQSSSSISKNISQATSHPSELLNLYKNSCDSNASWISRDKKSINSSHHDNTLFEIIEQHMTTSSYRKNKGKTFVKKHRSKRQIAANVLPE